MAPAHTGLLRHVTLILVLQTCVVYTTGKAICSSPERSVLLSCGRTNQKQGQWYFNDPSSFGFPLGLRDLTKSLLALPGRRITVLRDSSLLVQDLHPSDTGVYTCVETGTENIISRVNLYVLRDGGDPESPCGSSRNPSSITSSPISSSTLMKMLTDIRSTSAPIFCDCTCAVKLGAICISWDCSACTAPARASTLPPVIPSTTSLQCRCFCKYKAKAGCKEWDCSNCRE